VIFNEKTQLLAQLKTAIHVFVEKSRRVSMLIPTKKARLGLSTTLISLTVIQACQATPAPEVRLASPVTSQVFHSESAVNGLQGWDNLPKPSVNQTVHIIKVATLPEASQYQLQVQIGLNIMQDCNQHRLMGDVQRIPLAHSKTSNQSASQYYYWVESLMQAPMVTMRCIEPKTATFVQLGETLLIESAEFAESIFYLPKHAQLRYRLWRADETWQYSPSTEKNRTSE
jgi:ecotin